MVYFVSTVPFDRIKPLVGKRKVTVNDPSVKAAFNSLPTPARNRNNAEAIWFTTKRSALCRQKMNVIFYFQGKVENMTRKINEHGC